MADFFGGGDESGGDVRTCGTFAVGAGHVDYFEIVLWIAEVFKEGGDSLEAEVDG